MTTFAHGKAQPEATHHADALEAATPGLPALGEDETLHDWEADPIELTEAQKKKLEPTIGARIVSQAKWCQEQASRLQDALKPATYLAWVAEKLSLGGVKRWIPVLLEGTDGLVAFATSWLNPWLPSFGAAHLFSVSMGIHGHHHLPFSPQPTPRPIYVPAMGMILWGESISVLINGLPAATQSSKGLQLCGGFTPFTKLYTGSASVFLGGGRASRTLSLLKGCEPLEDSPSKLSTWLKNFPPLAPWLEGLRSRWPRFIERVTRSAELMSSLLKHAQARWSKVADAINLGKLLYELEKLGPGPERDAVTFQLTELNKKLALKVLNMLLECVTEAYVQFWNAIAAGRGRQVLMAWRKVPMLDKLFKLLPWLTRVSLFGRVMAALSWLKQFASWMVADPADTLMEPLLVANTSPNVWIGGLDVPPNDTMWETLLSPLMNRFPVKTIAPGAL